MSLTKKQREMYEYICIYLQENGVSPSQQEIKEHFGLKSLGSIQRYLKYLSDAGFIDNVWNSRRGIQPLIEIDMTQSFNSQKVPDFLEIPLLGDVAAGEPILAIENNQDYIHMPTSLLSTNKEYFALIVKGDSMIEDGILQGDTIICEVKNTANNGETVVAIINGEATVKHFYKKNNIVELHPANSSMQPFIIDEFVEDFRVVGSLVTLIRNY